METSAKPNNKHIGRKITRIRELRGIKQETFAVELGISQQTVSRLEQSEEIEDDMLEKIANVLGSTPDGIRNFNEDAAINYFNNFHDSSGAGAFFSSTNLHCTFNPIDKWLEVIEENKKLYERLLASEKEKVEILKGKN